MFAGHGIPSLGDDGLIQAIRRSCGRQLFRVEYSCWVGGVMRSAIWPAAIAAAFSIVCAIEATAADCKLVRIGSADMADVDGDSRVFMPAQFGDQQRLLLVDTGAPLGSIAPDLVDKLRL